jgi:high-affinity K+ transport system ATPase subunit B
MKSSLATGSLLFFGLSVLFLLTLTAFESVLVGISPGVERVITLLFLVVPAGIGAALAAMSIARKEGQTGRAISGLLLNSLFALFHLLLILFAG